MYLELEAVGGDDKDAQIKAVYNKLLDLSKPKVLDTRVKGNAITEMDKNYQKTLMAFQESNIDARGYSIFEMMCAFEQKDEEAKRHKADMDKLKAKQQQS